MYTELNEVTGGRPPGAGGGGRESLLCLVT